MLVPAERDLKGNEGYLKTLSVLLKSYLGNAMVGLSLKIEKCKDKTCLSQTTKQQLALAI